MSNVDINRFAFQNPVTDFWVEEDYNLMAVNAFTPKQLGFYEAHTSFLMHLPRGDTPFKMIIIDPSDGAILFEETSSADMPWDGIDRNTGKMVDER